ncbi:F-box domain [Macleaya cordata]|uniref:F-box domain n=1 Tax=Macleaya cordata TaxID=56857 RepID=A0A200PVC2_MACCD|nr:F-box domain [Macleaya cordata]
MKKNKKETNRSKASSSSTDIIGMGMENNFLPEEITMDILSRLPAESVLKCQLVCKTWRSLVHDPSFNHMHLLRHQLDDQNAAESSGLLGFIFLTSLSNNEGRKLCYLRYNKKDEQQQHHPHQTLITRISLHPPAVDDHLIVGSCNGLICISINNYSVGVGDPVYICNPITREYVILPYMDTKLNDRCCLVSGFGYNPSTNEYKVVRICCSNYEPFAKTVQVYTLGDGIGWRNKGEIMYKFIHHPRYILGILANGALHWLDAEQKIVAFDLVDENFRVLPPPPFLRRLNESNHFELQVFRGSLCALHYIGDKRMDVWSLKNNINSNYDMKEQGYQFWSWSKEFSSGREVLIPNQAITLTESGEVLLCYNRSTLFRYDMKTTTSEKLVKLDASFSSYNAIPHMNSFVSLKALGEEDTKIMGS